MAIPAIVYNSTFTYLHDNRSILAQCTVHFNELMLLDYGLHSSYYQFNCSVNVSYIHVEAPPLSLSRALVTYSIFKVGGASQSSFEYRSVYSSQIFHKMCHLFDGDNTLVPGLQMGVVI